MEQCGYTASINDKTPYQNGDSDFERNYSLSDDSYSDSSDSNSSSLNEVKFCLCNETHNVDLYIGRENRKLNSKKKVNNTIRMVKQYNQIVMQ